MGDQYIISREQGSMDPLGASDVVVGIRESSFSPKLFQWASQNYIFCMFDLIMSQRTILDCVWKIGS